MKIRVSIDSLLTYLKNKGEITVAGVTYVWLDNHVVRTVNDVDYGIDGLAIKATMIDGQTGEEKPHYMGFNPEVSQFLSLVAQLTEEDWVGIHASNALRSMNKKR